MENDNDVLCRSKLPSGQRLAHRWRWRRGNATTVRCRPPRRQLAISSAKWPGSSGNSLCGWARGGTCTRGRSRAAACSG